MSAIPRMNLYFKASVPEELLGKTDHVAQWRWFIKDEFLQADIHSSYDKAELVDVIFSE